MSQTDENGVSLGEISEAEILARVFPRLPKSASEILGPGDDAAVISAPDGRYVVTTDMMVEGPDFRLDWSSPYDIGFKAAAINLADVAAMGAVPTALVVALGAPSTTNVSVLEQIADGLRDACEQLSPGCGVVGGDLSSAPALVISITAHGDLSGRPPVTRSGARPGDVLAVAGSLGAASVGLSLLFSAAGRDEFSEISASLLGAAQLRPMPPIGQGPIAADAGATAAMDVSDGLVLDASRLATASGVSVAFDLTALEKFVTDLEVPAHAHALTRDELFEGVLYGGESHALLASFPPNVNIPESFSVIGRIVEPQKDSVFLDGRALEIRGWHPFSY